MADKRFGVKHGLNVLDGVFQVNPDGKIIANGKELNPDASGIDIDSGQGDLPVGYSVIPATVDGVDGYIAITVEDSNNPAFQQFFGNKEGTSLVLARQWTNEYKPWVLNEQFNYPNDTTGTDLVSYLDNGDYPNTLWQFSNNAEAFIVQNNELQIVSSNMPTNDLIQLESMVSIDSEDLEAFTDHGDFDVVAKLSNINCDVNHNYNSSIWNPADVHGAGKSLAFMGVYCELNGTLGDIVVGAATHPDPAIGDVWGVFDVSDGVLNGATPFTFVPRTTNYGSVKIERLNGVTKGYYSNNVDGSGNDVWTDIGWFDTSSWVGKGWETSLYASGGLATTGTIHNFKVWGETISYDNQDSLTKYVTNNTIITEGWTPWVDMTVNALLSDGGTIDNKLNVTGLLTPSGGLNVNDLNTVLENTDITEYKDGVTSHSDFDNGTAFTFKNKSAATQFVVNNYDDSVKFRSRYQGIKNSYDAKTNDTVHPLFTSNRFNNITTNYNAVDGNIRNVWNTYIYQNEVVEETSYFTCYSHINSAETDLLLGGNHTGNISGWQANGFIHLAGQSHPDLDWGIRIKLIGINSGFVWSMTGNNNGWTFETIDGATNPIHSTTPRFNSDTNTSEQVAIEYIRTTDGNINFKLHEYNSQTNTYSNTVTTPISEILSREDIQLEISNIPIATNTSYLYFDEISVQMDDTDYKILGQGAWSNFQDITDIPTKPYIATITDPIASNVSTLQSSISTVQTDITNLQADNSVSWGIPLVPNLIIGETYYTNGIQITEITMPISGTAVDGDEITLYDKAGHWSTPSAIAANGNSFNGVEDALSLDVAYSMIRLKFTGSTWIVLNS